MWNGTEAVSVMVCVSPAVTFTGDAQLPVGAAPAATVT
jgi:hypothetical protein